MSGLGLAVRTELMDAAFNKASFTSPTSFELRLSSTDPGADGSGATQPSGDGYAGIALLAADFVAAAGANSAVALAADQTFTATDAWLGGATPITYAYVWDTDNDRFHVSALLSGGGFLVPQAGDYVILSTTVFTMSDTTDP